MRYTLFGARRSSSCSVECAISEANAEYELIDIDLAADAQHANAYLAVNATGKIPALRLPSGDIITESSAILITVADLNPASGLLPERGTDARAQALRWLAFCASEIYPMVEIVDYPERFCPTGEQAQALRESARKRMRNRCMILERAISGDPWLLSAGFSIVDLYAANLTRWDVGGEWRAANCPKLESMARAISERPKAGPVWRRHFGEN